ncbi:MAG TPA: ATP-binding protein [Jatrophihabitans sp.]|jgi:signal transduction histidine kinase
MRRRILLLAVGMTTLVVLAFAIPLMFLTHKVVGDNADATIRQEATSIANFVRATQPGKAELAGYVQRVVKETGHPVSVVLPDGTRVGTTPADGDERPPPGPPSGSGAPPEGDRETPPQVLAEHGGVVAATVAETEKGRYAIRVFLPGNSRYEGEKAWYALIIGGSLALIVLGSAAGEVLTRRITRPLVRTADTAQRLSTGDITARAPTDGPREVADVGVALNRLADRIDELIVEERETVADLSHRLRTPLTTLRLEAEALHDPAEAERVGNRVSELERMLTAVIRAARRPQREGRLPLCDAALVVRERVEFWSALTDEQGRPSTISVPDRPVPVRASAEDLAAAVDALLTNVVAHTAEGTAFAVTLTADDDGARLEVSDAGAGIPDAAEVRGRSDRDSSGLGLDIARRCAEAAGGSMTVGASPSGGALITLSFRGVQLIPSRT